MAFNPCANWSSLRAAAAPASCRGLPQPQGPLTGQGELPVPSPWSQALGSWPPGWPRAGLQDPAGKKHTTWADASQAQGRLLLLSLGVNFSMGLSGSIFYLRRYVFVRHWSVKMFFSAKINVFVYSDKWICCIVLRGLHVHIISKMQPQEELFNIRKLLCHNTQRSGRQSQGSPILRGRATPREVHKQRVSRVPRDWNPRGDAPALQLLCQLYHFSFRGLFRADNFS